MRKEEMMIVKMVGAISVALFSTTLAMAGGDPEAGRTKSEACLGCHGIPSYNNVYPTYHVPKLSGQYADYLVAALKAYRDGQRQHGTMSAQAFDMTDVDMADIAAFWQAQGK
jgi:cytochrome c553